MNRQQILFLILLSFLMGSTTGFLAMYANKKQPPKVSDTFKEVTQLSDEDFLIQYDEKKDSMSTEEQVLGNRLHACLEKNQNLAGLKKKKQKNEPYVAEKSVSNSKPEVVSEPSDELSLYGRAGTNIPARYVPKSVLLKLFGNNTFQNPNEDNFGIENGLIEDAKEFLKKHNCKNPSFTVINDERKNRSKFFDLVKDNSFHGNSTVKVGNASKKLPTKMRFNSPSHHGYDYLEVVDNQNNFLEKRIIKSEESDEAWRYSSCEPSVVLVSDKCPWNNQYAYEFKDFYLSPDSKKMVGNIYCKNPSDQEWTNVGMLELNQTAEDRE